MYTHKKSHQDLQSKSVSPCKEKFRHPHDNGSDKENNPGTKPAKRQRTHYNPSLANSDLNEGSGLTQQEFYRHAAEMEKRIVENLEETRAILRELVFIIQVRK
jgi:hypothetical protein